MEAVLQAYERNAALIMASEKWSDGYMQAPEQHGLMLKAEGRLERKLLLFFRDMAKKADSFVFWNLYGYELQKMKASRVDAYDVNVMVNDDAIQAEETPFVTVIFEDIALATALGAQAGEVIYNIPLGLESTDAAIQKIVKQQIGDLVGKKVDENGKWIDNPKAKYRITDKTRADIRASIQTSIDLGEDVQTAQKRLQTVIRNPRRAKLIAQEEITTAYANGMHEFGEESGAIGKQWEDNGAVDICKTNTLAGPIPFKDTYPGGVTHPKQHIGCRCFERIIYQNELDDNPNLFDKA